MIVRGGGEPGGGPVIAGLGDAAQRAAEEALMLPKVLCVVGPTASGKTKLGVLLAKKYNGEVVSIDSMQIYQGMTIGTAAPTVAAGPTGGEDSPLRIPLLICLVCARGTVWFGLN